MCRALASEQGGQRSKGTDVNQRERTRAARAALPSPADDRPVPEEPENSAWTERQDTPHPWFLPTGLYGRSGAVKEERGRRPEPLSGSVRDRAGPLCSLGTPAILTSASQASMVRGCSGRHSCYRVKGLEQIQVLPYLCPNDGLLLM